MDLATFIKRGKELAQTPEKKDAITAWGNRVKLYIKENFGNSDAMSFVAALSPGSFSMYPEPEEKLTRERKERLLRAIEILEELQNYDPTPTPAPLPSSPKYANYNIQVTHITIAQVLDAIEKEAHNEPDQEKKSKLLDALQAVRDSAERILSQTLADVIKSKLPQ